MVGSTLAAALFGWLGAGCPVAELLGLCGACTGSWLRGITGRKSYCQYKFHSHLWCSTETAIYSIDAFRQGLKGPGQWQRHAASDACGMQAVTQLDVQHACVMTTSALRSGAA